MSIPPPIRLAQPPAPRQPTSHRRRRRGLRSWLLGRRRPVQVTEPVGRLRRWLQRAAVPLIAMSVAISIGIAVLGWLFVSHVNHRLDSLEADRRGRKQATDQALARADAKAEELRKAFCAVIDGVPPGRPAVESLRKSLRCGPYVPPKASRAAQLTPTSTSSPTPPAQAAAGPSSTPAPSSSSTRSSSPTSTPSSSPTATQAGPPVRICVTFGPGGQLCV